VIAVAKTKYQKALEQVGREVKKLDSHKFEVKPAKNESVIYLFSPWEDESIALIAYDSDGIKKDLFSLLERIRLPTELSAIYHIESNKLEIIWTAYKLGEGAEDIRGREFEFEFREKSYKCRFSESSEDLLSLASHAAYMKISETAFRNLQSFSAYKNDKAHEDPQFSERLGTPISFFIENLSDDHEEWFEVVKHLNFYLKFYDNDSPFIVVHDREESRQHNKIRYIEGSFPKKISSRQLNGTLLALWTAAYTHDVTTRFLLYYRILEYVSGTYLQAKQRQSLLKILSSPTAQTTIDKTLDSVAQIVRQDAMNEFDRFNKLFNDLVDRDRIWQEICAEPEAFTLAAEFDGGLRVEAIVDNTNSIDAFGPNGMTSISTALRKIRHALAHGGEQQVGQLILPTNRNFDMLIPWTHVAMVAAGEVMLYEHLG
jgi:hypothetical protein